MAYTTRIDWEPLRSIDSATFVGTYLPLGGPLLNPSYKLKLVNNSNVLVTVSKNGTSDIDVAPANSFWLYDEDVTQNHEAMSEGTQIFVKGSVGVGLVYLVTQFILQN